jgi:hypothetical protein
MFPQPPKMKVREMWKEVLYCCDYTYQAEQEGFVGLVLKSYDKEDDGEFTVSPPEPSRRQLAISKKGKSVCGPSAQPHLKKYARVPQERHQRLREPNDKYYTVISGFSPTS